MRIALTIVVSVVAGLMLLWLTLLIGWAVLKPGNSTLRDATRILPDTGRLIHRLARDHQLSMGVRTRLWMLLAYLAVPIDLVPDFIPVLGYADDAIVIGLVLRSVIRRAGPQAVRQHWPGSHEGLVLLARLCRLPNLTEK